MTDMRKFINLVEGEETLHERLSPDFVESAYGYWIKPDGTIINVEKKHGHVDVLETLPEVRDLLPPVEDPFDPFALDYVEDHEWYEAALGNAWVRVIASGGQFHYQFKRLTNRARRALMSLITGLEPFDVYVFESSTYETFSTQREALAHIRGHATVVENLSTKTWRS